MFLAVWNSLVGLLRTTSGHWVLKGNLIYLEVGLCDVFACRQHGTVVSDLLCPSLYLAAAKVACANFTLH